MVCIAGFLWNVGGAANYLMQTSPEFVATLPDSHRAIINGRPVWATGGFAVGVFGGALACLALMFKQGWSRTVFLASLLGILVTVVHTVNIALSPVEFTGFEGFMMIASPVLVALALLWFAHRSIARYRFA